MKAEGTGSRVPVWVWAVILIALLWAGVYYVAFSLPSYLTWPS